MLSSGEEMQSINEELETAQEELQSTNQELRSRNLELGQVSDDLSNLLTSVSFPIIMVGRDLRIRRFTPAAPRLLKVIASDVGRLITDLRLRIDVPDLEELLGEVIDTMALKERDVQDDEGRWYAMQLRPYKTFDNRIDGAVMTLFDIDEMKRMLAAEKSVAVTLQKHYIHALPEIAGLELALVTETAHHRNLVGGDFHDVFRLPDGKVLLLIGDVAGKGVEAAGLAETVRIAARATALVSPSPEEILRNVHRLVADDDSDEFVTALVVTLDLSTGEAMLASAGHLPPVHLSGRGAVSGSPTTGTPWVRWSPTIRRDASRWRTETRWCSTPTASSRRGAAGSCLAKSGFSRCCAAMGSGTRRRSSNVRASGRGVRRRAERRPADPRPPPRLSDPGAGPDAKQSRLGRAPLLP